MKRFPLLIIATLFFFSCQDTPQDSTEKTEETSTSLDFELIAKTLMERADLQPGEKVLLVGKPGRFDELIPVLRQKITAEQGVDLGVISASETQPESWSTDYTKGVAGMTREEMIEYFGDLDLGIMLPGPTPDDEVYAAIQDLLRKNTGRTIHFHWAGAYSIDNQLLELTPEIDAFYQRVMVETDYEALAEKQKNFETAMRNQVIQVTTPAGTDLTFEIGDRPVTKQDGDASAARANAGRNLIDREIEIPAGAIRVAPIEETVNGKIVFPDMIWGNRLIQGLVMDFEAGKVVSLTATKNLVTVEFELAAAGEAGKSFREFAIGMNPLLAIPSEGEKWIPYYGYGSGIIRLSLGDNLELGGKVGGGYVRWNFFTDATVRVGDEIWVLDGVAVK